VRHDPAAVSTLTSVDALGSAPARIGSPSATLAPAAMATVDPSTPAVSQVPSAPAGGASGQTHRRHGPPACTSIARACVAIAAQ
jgi:hypothetical protein